MVTSLPLPPLSQKDINRFWSKVDRSGGPDACWPWMGKICKGHNGYGRLTLRVTTLSGLKTRVVKSHRVAYFLGRGKDLAPHLGCHSCDNRACCNPSHIWSGSYLDNSEDAKRKGRNTRGEYIPQHKLTSSQVLEVRQMWGTGTLTEQQIADHFNVNQSTVHRLLNGENWAWLKGENQ